MPSKPFRGFIVHSKAWYHEANKGILENRCVVENILFGLFYKNGGGDFTVSADWHDLSIGGRDRVPTLRIDIFEDAFVAFKSFHKFFMELAKLNGTNPQPAEFIKLLKRHGFEDITETENPNDKPKRKTRKQERKLELED